MSKEKLALQGAIILKERQITNLRTRVKVIGVVLRDALAVYHLMHPEELDIDQIQANYEIFSSALRDLRQAEAELQELKAEV